MKQISKDFEALHNIPFILGAINGNHIPIIASSYDFVAYYYRKRYYSYLLQGL